MESRASSSPSGAARAPERDQVFRSTDHLLGSSDYQDQDALLPQQNAPISSSAFNITRERWTLLILLVVGTFLATCPLPRYYLPDTLREAFITLDAFLVSSLSSRRRNINVHRKTFLRILAAYLGFYLATYALFGAAEDVHIERQWHSLFLYRAYNGYRLGYIARLALVMAGFFVQRAAGFHSRARILGSYLLSMLWLYADAPMTIFDLARGRQNW